MSTNVREDLSETGATERWRVQRDVAVRRVQDAMSATPGWQAAAKAAAAHAVLVASECEAEKLVNELFEAHASEGEQNPKSAARRVGEGFLSKLDAPGASFFEGSAPEVTSLAPVALKHAAEFESWRDALVADLPARFSRTLEARAQEASRPRAARWRPLESGAVFGFLLLTAAMSVCGLSWLDVARRVFALF